VGKLLLGSQRRKKDSIKVDLKEISVKSEMDKLGSGS
jgi:hypothetical protein